MQEKIKEILLRISKEKNIPIADLLEAYKAPYKMMVETWAKIDVDKEETYNHHNFYMMKLGTFYVQQQKINRVKKWKEKK